MFELLVDGGLETDRTRVSLYMYGFDVVNTAMSCMELSPESGAQVRMNDGYVTQTPTAGHD
jgi:hypothetical protein